MSSLMQSEESLCRDKTKALRQASHEQCNCQQVTVNFYCQFSLVNLCGRESLCDIRQDCWHHFFREWDFEHDAQRVCQAERSLKSPLASHEQCIITM